MSSHQLNSAFTVAKYRDASPDGPPPLHSADVRHPARSHRLPARPITIGWYGLCYAIGLAVAYVVLIRLARAAGEDPDIVGNGIIIVSIAALIGGRLYHVIDQWALYANDPLKIILPPYSGLGVYGGIVTGTLAAWWYARRRGVSFARWADIVAPALFVMQAIGRWGNYFNQELYGPPTTRRGASRSTAPTAWPSMPATSCPRRRASTRCSCTSRSRGCSARRSWSSSGIRLRSWLRPGDLLLVFFIWYGVDALRAGDPARGQLDVLRRPDRADRLDGVHRGRRGGAGPAPSRRTGRATGRRPIPQRATWGALGAAWMTRPIDEPWANVGGGDGE